ncbi:MAG: DUF116 domain-containing protein [Chloroflexi bacterium]|nr:DUF116 domain-containing protein [Chloroflexota bacterium]
MENGSRKDIAPISPSDRVLLLSHCLRPSQTCPGRFRKEGLVCPESCDLNCAIGRLRTAAVAQGYKGVCVAAGGAMALKFVVAQRPRGVIAVACSKELAEGVRAAKTTASLNEDIPRYAMVALRQDGCVDTEVDEAEVLEAILAGCEQHLE